MAELCVEQDDDRIRKAAEITERYKKRLAIRSESEFIKHYVNGELRLGLACCRGEFDKCGFTFQALRLTDGNIASFRSHDKFNTWFDHDGNQPFMLSQNVELMEGPQRTVTSLVRLERFDYSNFALGQPPF